jgi:hypothetical protein
MSLQDEISAKRKEIRTDGYPMSIGEWISLYEGGEVDIHPEFQRFYRWSEAQKTNLIESLLLGIPIPPIFVSQRSDGVWDVVDGLQRLSTIFQLLGILRDEDGKLVEPLVLEGTKYLPSLKGKQWEHPTDEKRSLPPDARLLIKRSKISASIILRESDETAKYDLFQRLNTGGSQLSPQEVRNCILVMLNRDLYLWLRGLADYEPFKNCVALSERPLEEAYDIELVLRFIVFSRIQVSDLKEELGDVGVFLTERMRQIAVDPAFKKDLYDSSFRKTFDALERTVSGDAFRRFDLKKQRHEGGFLLSQYEVVSLGLGYNIGKVIPDNKISGVIKSIWSDESYTKWTGSGIRATSRLPRVIPLGRKLFAR